MTYCLVLEVVWTILPHRALDRRRRLCLLAVNKKQFDEAAQSVLGHEDKLDRDQPWR